MNQYTLQTELWLPRPRDQVFPFFAKARNLETMTPPWLRSEVLTPPPTPMRSGTLPESSTWQTRCDQVTCRPPFLRLPPPSRSFEDSLEGGARERGDEGGKVVLRRIEWGMGTPRIRATRFGSGVLTTG